MKLVASLVVRNELDRYLRDCIDSLLGFCDEIRILDDGSTDGWQDELMGAWGDDGARVFAKINPSSTFFVNEGRTRQQLLEWTMEAEATHVLAIDADEFVGDGQLLREAIEGGSHTGIWKLSMSEVWRADQNYLYLRADGAWRPRPIGIVYAVPPDRWTNRQTRRHWRMPEKALACGRTPIMATMMGNRTTAEPVTPIFHFGWACQPDRAARHARYVEHDGGQHHASKHLDSIMWDDQQVKTIKATWPSSLPKAALLERVNRP